MPTLTCLFWLLLLAASVAAQQTTPSIDSKAGIPAPPTLPTAIESGIEARRTQLFTWSQALEETHGGRGGLKYMPYDIVAQTARDGCGQVDRAAYMAALGKMGLTDSTKPIPFEMFSLPPLVRYLYLFGHCMSDSQKAELLQGLSTTPRYLFGHGTMNHMIMQQSSWYLLAQYFPQATWTDWSKKTYTSAEVIERGRDLLARRNWRFFQSGQNEMMSSTYAETNLFPLLNLIDFAADAEVAGWARNEATLEVLLLKANSFHGSIVAPLARRNTDQTNAPLADGYRVFPSIAQHILWYYFGEPQQEQFDFIQKVREPIFLIMNATSAWRPPTEAYAMPTANYAVRYVTPDFARWDDPAPPTTFGDAWIGRSYALGTGNRIYNPAAYNDHDQTFSLLWQSTARRNQFECRQPYWNSNAGEDDWSVGFWSPFVEDWRIDTHRAVLLADIPPADPWTTGIEPRFWTQRDRHKDALLQLVECRIPRAVDELSVKGNWVFFRSGPTHVAVAALHGSLEMATPKPGQSTQPEFDFFKVREAKTALFVFVDDRAESSAAFERRARKQAPSYDLLSNTVTTTVAGQPLAVHFMPPTPVSGREKPYWASLPQVTLGGTVVPFPQAPAFATPFLTLENGKLTLHSTPPLTWQGAPHPNGPRHGE